MASCTLTAFPALLNPMNESEIDAAHVLIGVSPSLVHSIQQRTDEGPHNAIITSQPRARGMPSGSDPVTENHAVQPESSSRDSFHQERVFSQAVSAVPTSAAREGARNESFGSPNLEAIRRRPRSGSAGLDALAALASESLGSGDEGKMSDIYSASAITSSSSEDESDNMPPPPPRRLRSASNPEGMEKWDSLKPHGGPDGRRHFVLPASILEVELAEASAAVENQTRSRPLTIPEHTELVGQEMDSHRSCAVSGNQSSEEDEEEKMDEENMTPEQLLRRARSRLLEDLSEGSVSGEKGVLTLPHSLGKYKEVYNKNGRIGIYTPAERAAIIDRFLQKRSRRVWNKKIRYNCRKSLADRRLRVKGRFVKRSEQEMLAKELAKREEEAKTAASDDVDMAVDSGESNNEDEKVEDIRNDPEAGFVPTEDQPYRRLRRHTIT